MAKSKKASEPTESQSESKGAAKVSKPKKRRPTKAQWRDTYSRVERAFESLFALRGLIAYQAIAEDVGIGLEVCAEELSERGGPREGWTGLCFTSEDDEDVALETGRLHITYWGTPRGAKKDMLRVGRLIVSELELEGLVVEWNRDLGGPLVVLVGEKPVIPEGF